MAGWTATSAQRIHQRYNDGSATVAMLNRMIVEREAGKLRCDHLYVLLRDAEQKQQAARAQLEEAGVRNF